METNYLPPWLMSISSERIPIDYKRKLQYFNLEIICHFMWNQKKKDL